ncbi:hypothetical protein Dsin_023435 [Dipteronia sinensis]|uniref:DUF4220 domain-containing protein n=2 Tax=Dipteronia sinensis TaxID=43782 RepID=A0AAE0E0P0_9ROSI|nr:hypothetical protein Dsin_023435 [Dipteronia sinensis]
MSCLAGTLKYLERTRALYLASLERFRDSMLKEPDPGPNYAKLIDDIASKKESRLRRHGLHGGQLRLNRRQKRKLRETETFPPAVDGAGSGLRTPGVCSPEPPGDSGRGGDSPLAGGGERRLLGRRFDLQNELRRRRFFGTIRRWRLATPSGIVILWIHKTSNPPRPNARGMNKGLLENYEETTRMQFSFLPSAANRSMPSEDRLSRDKLMCLQKDNNNDTQHTPLLDQMQPE